MSKFLNESSKCDVCENTNITHTNANTIVQMYYNFLLHIDTTYYLNLHHRMNTNTIHVRACQCINREPHNKKHYIFVSYTNDLSETNKISSGEKKKIISRTTTTTTVVEKRSKKKKIFIFLLEEYGEKETISFQLMEYSKTIVKKYQMCKWIFRGDARE